MLPIAAAMCNGVNTQTWVCISPMPAMSLAFASPLPLHLSLVRDVSQTRAISIYYFSKHQYRNRTNDNTNKHSKVQTDFSIDTNKLRNGNTSNTNMHALFYEKHRKCNTNIKCIQMCTPSIQRNTTSMRTTYTLDTSICNLHTQIVFVFILYCCFVFDCMSFLR